VQHYTCPTPEVVHWASPWGRPQHCYVKGHVPPHKERKGKVTCFLSITYHWPQLAVKLPLTHCTQKCKQFVPLYNIDMLFTQMPLKIKTLFFDVLHRSGNVLTYKCMCLHHQPNLITSSYYHILITRLFWFPCSSISIFINRINAILLTDISVCHQK